MLFSQNYQFPTFASQHNFPCKLSFSVCDTSNSSALAGRHRKKSLRKERKKRNDAIESIMLDLAQPSHSLRKLRRSGSACTTVVKKTQKQFHRKRWRSGRRECHQEIGMEKKKKQRAQAVLRTVVSPFQVHPSLLLGALSSLAEMDYASKRKE